MRFYTNDDGVEGMGMQPDIWVRGDALEAVYRMIDYCQLKTGEMEK